MVFVSGDHLHAKTVPLFMRPNQTFVEGRISMWKTPSKAQTPQEVAGRTFGTGKPIPEQGIPLDPSTPIALKDVHALTIERKVNPRKGKWDRFPPEVL
jgi:hypothetical protein